MTRSDVVLEKYEADPHGSSPVFLSSTAKAFNDAIHKEGAALASTDKRLAIEPAIVQGQGSVW